MSEAANQAFKILLDEYVPERDRTFWGNDISLVKSAITERDRLAAENERLREVVMRIADISGVGQSLKYDDAVFTIGRIHSIAMASIPEASNDPA